MPPSAKAKVAVAPPWLFLIIQLAQTDISVAFVFLPPSALEVASDPTTVLEE